MSAPNMGNGMSAPTGGLTTPTGRVPTTMPMAAPQFSHHHGHTDGPEAKHEDLNGATDYPGTTQSQRRPVGNAAVVSADRSDEVDEKDVFGDLPDGKRRKFILVDNAGKRIRVKVMLDQVNVSEIPESYRKKYSVFPRSFNSTDGGAVQEEPRYRRYFNDEGADNGESIVTRTSVPAPLPDGTDGQVQVPCISRMDAYRDKMRSSIIGSGQDESVSPHFERRQGKRRWADIEKRASDAPMPAAPKQ
ncbi:putative ribosomal protein l24e [Phaeomoniella chlamydospora]|uniref:Putative ribosomal protein l24e n=1 Tax=Phaeomoniella chlamydospora TaxID=158046 RepID=A0A0G2EA29_PHACM|nr:putative ribosomal protein l24e [Phaeomoniella chlamydospora]